MRSGIHDSRLPIVQSCIQKGISCSERGRQSALLQLVQPASLNAESADVQRDKVYV